MNGNRVKALWKEGKPVTQAWINTAHPEVCTIMATLGYDAVVVDWQHGIGANEKSVVECIRAINSVPGVAAFVRLPKADSYYISHVLDAGASGVIVPMVNTREEAEYSGLNCRYSPTGYRSLAHSPFKKPEESTEDYTNRANEEIICLVMIETRKAIANIEGIVQAPGIDGIYVGPYDLSLDMEVPIASWFEDDRHFEAIKHIFQVTKNAGLVAGHHGSSANAKIGAKMVKIGAQICQVGSDLTFFSNAGRQALKDFRDELDS